MKSEKMAKSTLCTALAAPFWRGCSKAFFKIAHNEKMCYFPRKYYFYSKVPYALHKGPKDQ